MAHAHDTSPSTPRGSAGPSPPTPPPLPPSERQRGSEAASTMYRGGGALRCDLTFLWPPSSGAKQDGAERTTLTGSTDIILCIYLIGFESCTCCCCHHTATVTPLVDRARLAVLRTFQPQDHHLHAASLPSTLTSYFPLPLYSCSSLSVSPTQAPQPTADKAEFIFPPRLPRQRISVPGSQISKKEESRTRVLGFVAVLLLFLGCFFSFFSVVRFF